MHKYNSDIIKITEALTKRYGDISLENIQKLAELRRHFIINFPSSVQNIDKHFIPAIIESNTFYDLIERYQSVKDGKRGVTLERMKIYYGEELGQIKFDSYRNKQALTNGLDYKKEKFGWGEEEFRSYNKSRSITIENMIKKYGVDIGTQKFNEYCEKQSYTKTLTYFIEKYGEEKGTKKYTQINKTKSHNLENYIRLYGETAAEEKLIEFFAKLNGNNFKFYSGSSQVCFWCIDLELPELAKSSRFAEKSGAEFASYSKINSRCYMYDYVATKHKIVIEYHGDHWHANPKLYSPSDTLKVRRALSHVTAAEQWETDFKKQQHIESLGFKYLVIWESDWISNRENVIERLKSEIYK